MATRTLLLLASAAATIGLCHGRLNDKSTAAHQQHRALVPADDDLGFSVWDSAPSEPRFVSVGAELSTETGRRCSVYNAGYGRRRGRCIAESSCTGDSVSGHCRGGSSIKCCVEPIPCAGSNNKPGFCKKSADCTDGVMQSSSQGARGCGRLTRRMKCCVQSSGYVVPGMQLIPQDKTMSCWFASGQMIIQWRRNQRMMTEIAHPDPSQVARWKRLYKDNPGITNSQIRQFARDLGLITVPLMTPTMSTVQGWLETYGPLWVNGKRHITVIAGIKGSSSNFQVLVYDPAEPKMKAGQWRSFHDWYENDGWSGRDISSSVEVTFLHAPE